MPDTEVPIDTNADAAVHVETPTPPPEAPTEADGNRAEPEIHPLEPGGKRFDQVYARAKRAEEDARRLKEEKIALETELRVRKEIREPAPTTTKIFTNAELETAIEQGTITRAQAQDYREELVIKKAAREAKDTADREYQVTGQTQHVIGELDRYTKSVPELLDTSTTERKQVEDEYAWLVELHGKPKPNSLEQRRMELTAVRTVFGTVETLEKKRGLDKVARESRESTMETHSSGKPTSTVADGPPKGMPPTQVDHYRNMFKRTNDYPNGWKDVQVEIDEYTKRTGKRLW